MAERLSTETLRQGGSRRLTIKEDDRFVNTFQNAGGSEKFLNAANVALTDKTLVSTALNAEQYFAMKSFFQTRGVSEQSAIAMALVSIDAAKVMGVSPISLTETLDDSELIFQFQTFVAANVVRPISAQHTYLVEKKNSRSLRSRNILP